ncbi:hydroxyethylthiazole kinase [Glutamicibacter endophyticus]
MRLSVVAERMRAQQPLVFCLTNVVVSNFTANVLLAAGAAPAMTNLPGEAREFAKVASAVLVNLGTPTTEQMHAMEQAVVGANEANTPWILDPVAVGALGERTDFARSLLPARPTLIRGNASEILALAGFESAGRGVDSTDSVTAAMDAGTDLARRYGSVVAISGPADAIIDADRTTLVHTDGLALTKVTGGGCALGAFTAAMVAAGDEVFEAAVSAHAWYGLAAERAWSRSRGPGSFAVNFLDELGEVTPNDIDSVRHEKH